MNERGTGRRAPSFCMVILGASGDLTSRKLIPALFGLFKDKLLPKNFAILGFARREKSDDSFRAELLERAQKFSRFAPIEDKDWEAFAKHIFYQQGDFEDKKDYDGLQKHVETLKKKNSLEQDVFYLATAPNFFAELVETLAEVGLVAPEKLARVVVEKPFGRDLESAKALVNSLHSSVDESCVYRIDHYLGKETVQNLLYFRFANAIFEPIWNRSMIQNIQITVAEDEDVGKRGGYYDDAGAMRDMLQNHLMQLLAITAMEPPASLNSEAIRDEKVKVLRSIPTPPPKCFNCVRGQYEGYRETERVNPRSNTETYIAVKLLVDNWRWAGVPFYLRTGKSLAARSSEIVVAFKQPPMALFNSECDVFNQNLIHVRLQPNEGVHLSFNVKQPGKICAEAVEMDFAYHSKFGSYTPEAYERLLYDVIVGDSTLFTRADEVLEAWRVVDGIRVSWGQEDLPLYRKGSWGPREADDLLKKDGNFWAKLASAK